MELGLDLQLADGPGRPVPEPSAPGIGRGPALFASCAACHSLTSDGGNKAGPTLAGLFGRRAGRVAGYAYSPALRNSGIVWTEATVARLLDLGPDRLVPGSKMPLQRLPNPRDRAELIAYLKRMRWHARSAISRGAEPMKPFLLGVVAAVGIAVTAYYAVHTLNWSSASTYSSPTVRL